MLWRVPRCPCGWCLHGHTRDQRGCFDVGVGKMSPGGEAGPRAALGAWLGMSRYAEGSYRMVGTRRYLPLDSAMPQGADDHKTAHFTLLI